MYYTILLILCFLWIPIMLFEYVSLSFNVLYILEHVKDLET